MRIVIVGATGNVGTALLDRLERDGHELVGVVRTLTRPPRPPRSLCRGNHPDRAA